MQRLLFILGAVATALAGSLVLVSPLEAGGGGHGGCSSTPRDATGDVVTIEENCFQSRLLYTQPGTTVTWTNQDGVPHNVTFLDGSVAGDDREVMLGGSVSRSFDAPGLFAYYCSLHPSMFGVVAVGDPASPAFATSLALQSKPASPPPAAAPSIDPPATAVATGEGGSMSAGLTAALVVAVGLVSAGGGYMIRRRRS